MTINVFCPYGVQSPESGGVTALKTLVNDLKTFGVDAKLATSVWGFEKPDIAVYAEGIEGNPLDAKIIVRWLLYSQPGNIDYWENEQIFKWHESYTAKNPSQVIGLLYTLGFNINSWVNREEKREGTCYAVRKGAYKVTHEMMSRLTGAHCIDAYPNNEFLYDVFNKYEKFVCFDEHTLLSLIAAQCGCVSIVVPTEGLTAEEWRKDPLAFHKYGIAYGFDDVPYALATVSKIRSHIKELDRVRVEKQKFFISFCENEIAKFNALQAAT